MSAQIVNGEIILATDHIQNGCVSRVTTELVRLREKVVRDTLVHLGWTPPGAKAEDETKLYSVYCWSSDDGSSWHGTFRAKDMEQAMALGKEWAEKSGVRSPTCSALEHKR